ncbi:unnamed protein product [Euphydryas editha]|uniref:Uncharacterized protein n=1 Tax=Euphydryas editha TaxID=104508 RepID=A0AAU9UCJ6_EUPED|nr:unnamed protein product [Euphydryas editha]
MVKFGKNKLKVLKKLAKKQNASPINATNKVLKKKINVEKKVTFQKEVLLRETVKNESLVQHILKKSQTDISVLSNLFKSSEKTKQKSVEGEDKKPKLKPVEKKKKRRKTQINDTKFLLNLMKNKCTN